MTDYYPYEIHVTVRSPDVTAFRAFCTANALKPIILDLQDREGTTVLTDVMTSSKFVGTAANAWKEMREITRTLVEVGGFNVVRHKIETVPWYPASGRYFEAHIAVQVKDGYIDDLRETASLAQCHMSQNVFKRAAGGSSIFLLTRRHYGSREAFEKDVIASVAFIALDDFQVLKVEKELCIYDSNTDHDTAWIDKAL